MELRTYLKLKAVMGFIGCLSIYIVWLKVTIDSPSDNGGVLAVAKCIAIPMLYGLNALRLSFRADEGVKVDLSKTVESRFLTGVFFIAGCMTLIVPPIANYALNAEPDDMIGMLSLLLVIPIGFVVYAIFTKVKSFKTRLVLALLGFWCSCLSAVEFFQA